MFRSLSGGAVRLLELTASTHGECIEPSLVCVRIRRDAKGTRANKATAGEVIFTLEWTELCDREGEGRLKGRRTDVS